MVGHQRNIVYDKWLTKILQRDVYKFIVDDDLLDRASGETCGYNLFEDLQTRPVFVYTKVPTQSLRAVRFLEQLGFHLVDTNIILDKPVSGGSELTGNTTVRFAVPEDQNQVVDLAGKNFVYSRFHVDKAIPDEVANTVKAEWSRNYFFGKRGDQMVVALMDKVCVGFLQLLFSDETLIIDLIAVDREYRRRGVARDMIAYAEAKCGEFKQIWVGTQIVNIPSIKLYEKIGFRISDAQYIFHYHYP